MTFEELSFKEKIDHIFEYYKLHMGIGVGVIILMVSLLNIYVLNPAPDVMLDMTFRMSAYGFDMEARGVLEDALIDAIIEIPKSQTIQLELLETGETLDYNMVMASEAKFMGKAEVGELDIFVMDQSNYDLMLREGYLVDLVEGANTLGMQLPESALFEAGTPGYEDGKVYALNAKAMPGFDQVLLDEGPYYLGVFVNSIHQEYAFRAIEYLSE